MAGEDKVQVGGIVLPVDVDLTGLLEGLRQAKEKSHEHLSEWGQFAAVFEGMFAERMVEAVKEFVVESVKEMARLDGALDRTARGMKALGFSYDEAHKKIVEYSETVEQLTAFNKVEVIDSLNNVMLKTKNWTTALQVNSLAMDIATRTHKDLATVSNMLALAVEGHKRGVMMLSKELGIVGPAAKDAGSLIASLEKTMKGAALEANNAEDEFKRFHNEMQNLGEIVGKAVLPVLTDLSLGFRALAGNELARAQFSVEVFTRKIRDLKAQMTFAPSFQMPALEADLKNNNRMLDEALAKIKKLKGELPGGGSLIDTAKKNQGKRDGEEQAKKAADKEEAAIGNRISEYEKISDEMKKSQHESLIKNVLKDREGLSINEKQALLAGEMAGSMARKENLLTKINKSQNDGKAATLENIKALQEEYKQQEKITQEQEKLKLEALAFARTLVGPVSQGMQTYFDAAIKGTAKLEDAFAALGKSIAQSMLGAIAKWLEEMAAADLVLAGSAAASFEYVNAAGYVAAAALLASGAGAVRAVAANLAEGAVIQPSMGGTVVRVAEAGKAELITPLDKLDVMMKKAGGGAISVGAVHISLPNVKNANDFSNASKVSSGALTLLKEMQRVKTRSGNRFGAL